MIIMKELYDISFVCCRMVLKVAVYCDNNYYGDDCTVFCVNTHNCNGHFTCGDTGEKVCMDGWEGPDCKKQKFGHSTCPSTYVTMPPPTPGE